MQLGWSISPNLAEIPLMLDAVREMVETVLDLDDAGAVELAVAEALNNIVEHGQLLPTAVIYLDIVADATSDCVTIVIRDPGRPIPPTMLDNASASAFDFDPDDLINLPEGGMGLSIICAAMDEVAYETGAGGNQLFLTKRRTPVKSTSQS